MKHFFKVSVALLLSTIGLTYAVNPLKEVFKNRPWEFVEDEFIVRPKAEANRFIQHIKRIGIGLGGAVVGGAAGYQTANLFRGWLAEETHPKAKVIGAIVGGSGGSILGFAAGYKLAAYLIRAYIDFKTIKKFTVEWQENKHYTPANLQDTFNALFTEYSARGEAGLKKIAPEMMRHIRRIIWEHFPNKYKHYLKSDDEFTAKFFHYIVYFDVAEILSLVGKMFTGVVEAFAKGSAEGAKSAQLKK